MARILVVDDDETICSAFEVFLRQEGHEAILVSNAADAMEQVRDGHPQLVIMDIRMPGMDGLEALQEIRKVDQELPVVMTTAYGTSQTSIDAVRFGAFEYLMKPLDLDVVKAVIDKALRSLELTGQGSLADEAAEDYSLVNLVGKSPAMQEAYRMIGLLATNDVPALLTGEPGVGKHLVAKTIHYNSHRKKHPFVALNCREFSETVLEHEIFGSTEAGRGELEKADQGTLFLNHIDSLPLPAQVRLLKFLEENEFERPDSGETVRANCRVLAGAADSLAGLVAEGEISYRLWEHLSVMLIHLPPLRDRKDDIPELVTHYIRRFNSELGRNIQSVEDAAKKRLTEYRWPGNVGQLIKALKRACILARGQVLTVEELEEGLSGPTLRPGGRLSSGLEAAVQEALESFFREDPELGESPFHEIVGEVERVLVREALAATGGNQVKAAELLGVNRTTLRKKIELYDL